MATRGTYYFDTESFDNATTVYNDAALTIVSSNGWYSNDSIVRQQISGVLNAQQSCGTPIPTPAPIPSPPTPTPVVPSTPTPVAPTPPTPVAPTPPTPPTPVAPTPPTPVAPTPPTPVAPTPPTPVAPTPPTPSYTTLLIRDNGSGAGWQTSSIACSNSGSINALYASYGSTLSTGTYLFTNTALTVAFSPTNAWFLDEPRNNALFIDSSGQITSTASCAAPPPTPPTPPTPVAPPVYAYKLQQCSTGTFYDVELPQQVNVGTSVSYAGQCWEVYSVISSGAGISPQAYFNNCTACLNPPSPPTPPTPPTPVAPTPTPVGNCYNLYLQRGNQICSGSYGTYYFNNSTLTSATQVFSDSSCSTLMSGTYYFRQGNTYRLWTGSQFVQTGSC